MKTLFNVLISLFIIVIFYCCNKNENEKKSLDYNIREIKYLSDYIVNYQVNKAINIDSFNVLYNSIKVFNPNDSSLIYLYLFKGTKLLFIKKDSIKIYTGGGFSNSQSWLVPEVSELIKNNQRDSAIRLILSSGRIVYKFQLDTTYVNLISFNKKFNECYLLYLNRNEMLNWTFTYFKTISNNVINIDKVKFTNSWPYNIYSLRYYDELGVTLPGDTDLQSLPIKNEAAIND